MVTIYDTRKLMIKIRHRRHQKAIDDSYKDARIRRGRVREFNKLVKWLRPKKAESWLNTYVMIQELKRLANINQFEAIVAAEYAGRIHQYYLIDHNKMTRSIELW